MDIGVPREIKNHEYRVGITPSGVRELAQLGHNLVIEKDAGAAIGYTNDDYLAAGARIASSVEEVYHQKLVVKVKEPQAHEIDLLQPENILFTYLHLAASRDLTAGLLSSGATAIAYEMVTGHDGSLPLLVPMSEIAGRMSVQAGASSLQMANKGSGILLGGVPGVAQGKVVILGGGVVGTQAAKMAMGMGADVSILDINLSRLRYLDDVYGPRLKTYYAERSSIEMLAKQADLLIGAILLPGKRARKLITRDIIQSMRKGSVFVDVSIDQGGCAETSMPTRHQDPTYVVDGVVHYCVANIPGAVARTSTQALTNATLPYVIRLAENGLRALEEDSGFAAGLSVLDGKLTSQPVAIDLGIDYHAPDDLVSGGEAYLA